MVRAEDRALEDEVISTGYHIALPFELFYFVKDKTTDILSYSFFLEQSKEFDEKFGADPFTAEAKQFLYDKLTPIMTALEYDVTEAAEIVHLEYRAKNGTVDMTKVLPECELIDTLDGETWDNIPLGEFEMDIDDPRDRMTVIRDGGKVVCFAGLNDICDDDGLYELTVECEEEYRRRGYAASCVALLASHLLSLGEQVKYICYEDNVASARTAEAAGLELYSKCLPFVCMKIRDEDDEAEYDEENEENEE